ncbi:GNAT family N-acetyltransferase [Brevibacillus daliensis]|uniref:GNAT family N-acetyltransferase n=1 Tax=Brevibacillus daliensis TaxID=2892995 RepID=UPI001E4F7730|nr:GNAT family N-acetyltransferase [Brevibacillus daliensis]
MEIRKPNNVELEKIGNLSAQAIYDGTLGEVMPTYEKVQQLVQPLLAKGNYYLVAVEADEILGWVLIGKSVDQFSDSMHGFIFELYVLEEYRGKGISTLLMKEAVEHLKNDGHTEIRLSAKVENHAVKLYERMGFRTRRVTMSLSL